MDDGTKYPSWFPWVKFGTLFSDQPLEFIQDSRMEIKLYTNMRIAFVAPVFRVFKLLNLISDLWSQF